MAGPDVSGGKARRVYALVARGARAGVRGATLGRQPPPRTIEIGPNLDVQGRGFNTALVRAGQGMKKKSNESWAAGQRCVNVNARYEPKALWHEARCSIVNVVYDKR